ncbi:MAG: rod shape-determining protein RodA [marine bacterium B5-7]|nr:MAG: rod shape-determining protein RodA [marine bacterium B5-7]
MKKLVIYLALLIIPSVTLAGTTPAPAGVSLYIITPVNGATVSSPVTVRFGLSGMGVAPAGTQKDNTGHHHLIIDADLPDLDQPIPSDENYRHFGGGQTETSVELTPGEHTLQLLLGDFSHIPHNPPVVSEKITITVE